MRRPLPLRSALPFIALAVALPGASHASLGGTVSGVQADSARMGAKLSSVALGKYNRHDLQRTNGGMVHEYTNAAGQVFAVTWSGPGKPDLRSLLGAYFANFQATGSGAGRAMHGFRRPAQVSQSDLQIHSEGHMGWFRGVAFVPSLAPSGFAAADLATAL